jgi:glycerol-3-phosphate dehydrogenase (NAD(P)+)
MGTAFTVPLADSGHDVTLVGTHLDGPIVASLAAGDPHPRLGVPTPRSVKVLSVEELPRAVKSADVLVLGVSSPGVVWAGRQLESHLARDVPVLSLTKGMVVARSDVDARSPALAAIPDALSDRLRGRAAGGGGILAIAGPCIAGELACRRHSSVVLTSRRETVLAELAAALQTSYYHVHTSTDVAGVELCAAFKNFYAIAVGAARGALAVARANENSAKAHNPAAALFARSLHEMLVLCDWVGGKNASVWGLPGAGDLYVTVQSGRNARLGEWLGRETPYRTAREVHMKGETVEGADLAAAVGPALERSMEEGQLPSDRLPLARALLNTILRNEPFVVPWDRM